MTTGTDQAFPNNIAIVLAGDVDASILPLLEEHEFAYFDLNDFPELRAPELYANPSHVNRDGMRDLADWWKERE